MTDYNRLRRKNRELRRLLAERGVLSWECYAAKEADGSFWLVVSSEAGGCLLEMFDTYKDALEALEGLES